MTSRGKRSIRPLERDVQKAVLQYLSIHPKVAWVARMNTGALVNEDRFIKFGFKGLSDIIGMLKDGKFLAVEIKRPGERPTFAQWEFIKMVNDCNGIAFSASSVDECERELNATPESNRISTRQSAETTQTKERVKT